MIIMMVFFMLLFLMMLIMNHCVTRCHAVLFGTAFDVVDTAVPGLDVDQRCTTNQAQAQILVTIAVVTIACTTKTTDRIIQNCC